MPEPTKKSEILFAPVDVEGLKTPGQQIGPMRIAIQDGWPKEPRGTWRPGDYLNKCRCGVYFCGRKHSTMCWPCAEKYDQETSRIALKSKRGEPLLTPIKGVIADFQRVANKFWPPPALEQEISDGMRKITHPGAPEPMFVEHWIGWHLGRDGKPAPIICDGNPGYLAHVTKYRFQVPPDVVEHLTGTRECLMLDKFGAMEKDCRS